MNERSSLEFGVYYSLSLCEMHARFWSRADKWLTFIQIALGSAVFASVGDTMVFGALFVGMAAFTFVWQPGVTALKFSLQFQKYVKLSHDMGNMSDDVLSQTSREIGESDLPELGWLVRPAEVRAGIRMRNPLPVTLSISEQIMAWLAGDLPPTVAP